MRIGIDARMLTATGIGRYTKSLVENLAKIDSNNTYLLFLKSSEFNKLNLPKNFIKIAADFHWYGFAEQLKFPWLLSKNKIDLMHFPHFNIPLLFRGRFVVTIHDLTLSKFKTRKASTKGSIVYYLKHLFYSLTIKKAVKKSERIFTPSEFTKKEVIEHFPFAKNKVEVTLEGGPSEKLLNEKPVDPEDRLLKISKPFLLYVGNAYPHKNLDVLIPVFKKLESDFKIVLAGKEDYFYQLLKEKVKKEGLEEKIKFVGFVDDQELAWLYKNATVYIFPSLNEGFGLPLLEAASFGLPVICSGTSSLPEVMREAAIYFDPKSTTDIIAKIKQVFSSESLREQLKKAGYERLKFFSWQKMAEKTLDVYNKVSHEKINQ